MRMRPIGITLLLVLGLAHACAKDPEPECWDHTTRQGCASEGDACQFFAGAGRAVDGVCTEEPDEGWCAPAEFGGSATPSAWYKPGTGRTIGLGLVPFDHPPGWKGCPGLDSAQMCPSLIEACQVCLCDPYEEEDDGSSSSSSAGGSGSGDASSSTDGDSGA